MALRVVVGGDQRSRARSGAARATRASASSRRGVWRSISPARLPGSSATSPPSAGGAGAARPRADRRHQRMADVTDRQAQRPVEVAPGARKIVSGSADAGHGARALRVVEPRGGRRVVDDRGAGSRAARSMSREPQVERAEVDEHDEIGRIAAQLEPRAGCPRARRAGCCAAHRTIPSVPSRACAGRCARPRARAVSSPMPSRRSAVRGCASRRSGRRPSISPDASPVEKNTRMTSRAATSEYRVRTRASRNASERRGLLRSSPSSRSAAMRSGETLVPDR